MSENKPGQYKKPELERYESFGSYYDNFGLTSSATQAEIKAQFRKLAHGLHPDKSGDKSEYTGLTPAAINARKEQLKRVKEVAFKKLNEANQTLSDPAKRARYDSFQSRSFHSGETTHDWQSEERMRRRAEQARRRAEEAARERARAAAEEAARQRAEEARRAEEEEAARMAAEEEERRRREEEGFTTAFNLFEILRRNPRFTTLAAVTILSICAATPKAADYLSHLNTPPRSSASTEVSSGIEMGKTTEKPTTQARSTSIPKPSPTSVASPTPSPTPITIRPTPTVEAVGTTPSYEQKLKDIMQNPDSKVLIPGVVFEDESMTAEQKHRYSVELAKSYFNFKVQTGQDAKVFERLTLRKANTSVAPTAITKDNMAIIYYRTDLEAAGVPFDHLIRNLYNQTQFSVLCNGFSPGMAAGCAEAFSGMDTTLSGLSKEEVQKLIHSPLKGNFYSTNPQETALNIDIAGAELADFLKTLRQTMNLKMTPQELLQTLLSNANKAPKNAPNGYSISRTKLLEILNAASNGAGERLLKQYPRLYQDFSEPGK